MIDYTDLIMMRPTDKDDGPFRRNPPCSSGLDTSEEDVDDQPPEEQGDVECNVRRH